MEDDDDDGLMPDCTGMLRPTLIQELSKILDEYPDDGQILKELIQNAEDASASEMKILYDNRQRLFSQRGIQVSQYTKYFQSPALCVYNNEYFSKKDWEGIKQIGQSVKELDPSKVGRFGLGFKSVFHITDFPMIMSGEQMLIIDPYRDEARCCIVFDLKKLNKYKGFNTASFMEALGGMFGCGNNMIQKGCFKGTLFRFPLRHHGTVLSKAVYSDDKIKNLLSVFKKEASLSLIFLKTLEKMDLFTGWESMRQGKADFQVVIAGCDVCDVKKARKEMLSESEHLPEEPRERSFNLTVECFEKGFAKKSHKWIVVNRLEGSTQASPSLIELSNTLHYLPYVGVAIPYDKVNNFLGHIFCFLPLPMQSVSMTNLPVHVHGQFALSQNRQHLKWADVYTLEEYKEKTVKWNELLISETLPKAYFSLIQFMCGLPGCSTTLIARSLPDLHNTNDHFKSCVRHLFEKLRGFPFLFTSNKGGRWICCNEAVFPILDALDHKVEDRTIVDSLGSYDVNLIRQSDYRHVFSILTNAGLNPIRLSPEYISRLLKNGSAYKTFPANVKESLLTYILSSGNYVLLDDLQLLPLANGSYTTFQRRSTVKVYLCSKDQQRLFPGMEDRIIKQLPQPTRDLILLLAKSGKYQLAKIQEDDVLSLMRQSIAAQLGGSHLDGASLAWPQRSQLDEKWLQAVWQFFTYPPRNIPKDLPILPQIEENGKRYLHSVKQLLILREHNYNHISPGVVRCLESMSIVTLPRLPDYVTYHPHLMKNWVERPTVDGVLRVLSAADEESIKNFNQNAKGSDREKLVSFLGSYSNLSSMSNLWNNAKKVLQRLKIFHSHDITFLSVSEENRISQNELLPVPLPFRCLKCKTVEERNLAKCLGAQQLGLVEAIETIFQKLVRGSFYNESNRANMMNYFLKNFHHFQNNERLVDFARKINFVIDGNGQSKIPGDLFDPRNKLLVQMFNDHGKFPHSKEHRNLDTLTRLGLRSFERLSSEEILDIALNIHGRSSNGYKDGNLLSQASALIRVLCKHSELLMQWCNGTYLHHHLVELQIILPLKKSTSYPKVLPWYTPDHILCTPNECALKDHIQLVGSTMPLFSDECAKELTMKFHPNVEEPPVAKVIEQLYCIIDHYKERSKPELLPLITKIYSVLNDIALDHFSVLEMKNREVIWMGHGFCRPDEVYLDVDKDDIHLEPYLYKLPTEVDSFKEFFLMLGCMPKQCPEVFLNVQRRIQELGFTERPEYECRRDLTVVINILNFFKDKDIAFDSNELLLPIHTSTHTRLQLRPASECNYCNEEWLKDLAEEEGEEVFYVHQDIPISTATCLGVKSLTDSLLEDSLMDWEQELSLVSRIKSLLKGYKDGFSVPKELIQNADDAGASKVCFLYDERENLDCRIRLINDKMKECQGPALWAYNDALFSEADLVNITKVEGATKERDMSKTGKFGVGFCSVYNLTDVPSFVSGQHMVMFDPQGLYLTKDKKRGMKIDFQSLKNQAILRRMSNQFKPFNGVFDCNLNAEGRGRPYFQGSLFRFPLRTDQQRSSEISNIVYNQEEMKSLLRIFMQSAGNLLLFTQNVSEIELYHLSGNQKDPKEKTLIFKVTRELTDILFASPDTYLVKENKLSVVKVCAENFGAWKLNPRRTFTAVSLTYFVDVRVEFRKCDLFSFEDWNTKNKTKWVISWAIGSKECLQLALQGSLGHVLPIASTAVLIEEENGSHHMALQLISAPRGFYTTGHFFCTLPLPVETPFPFHVNGFFAITQDRKQLSLATVEEKQKFELVWNHAIMKDAVVTSFLQLLEGLKQYRIRPGKDFHSLWPLSLSSSEDSIFRSAQSEFLREVVESNPSIIYHKDFNEWTSFDKCKILDEKLLESQVGELAYKYSSNFYKTKGYYVTKIPGWLLRCFKEVSNISDKVITVEAFYSDVFFPALESGELQGVDRDNLLLFAVDLNNLNINTMLKSKHCFPSSTGILCKPSEIILPTSQLSSLYLPEDGCFLLLNKEYHNECRASAYKELGMVYDFLPEEWLIERLESVQNLLDRCSHCAVQRCRVMMEYLSKVNSKNGLSDSTVRKIQSICFLPVMMKPKEWTLKWHGEGKMNKTKTCSSRHKIEKASDIHLPKFFAMECPKGIFFDDCKDILGCVSSILHLRSIQCSGAEQTLKSIGVRGIRQKQIPVELVLCQLDFISDVEAKQVESIRHRQIFESVFKWLEQACKDSNKKNGITSSLQQKMEEKILLLNCKFWRPSRVCKSLKNSSQCDPHLVGIDETDSFLKECPHLLSILCIKKKFSSEDMAHVLIEFQSSINRDSPLDDQMLEQTCGLLEALHNALLDENIEDGTFPKLKGGEILIPDVDGILRPASKLCLDDDKMLRTTEIMHFVCSRIPPAQALKFGIRTKMRRRVKELRMRLPFGQKEELTTRIKRILDGYPADEGILKELLQNADDASASEIHFIMDFNYYSAEKVFEGSWKELQGPSLLVYNNTSFTERDLEGIQDLGIGSKGDDPTKTGQYGVGFNAVYHLTDVPSFITKGPDIEHGGETLCILDPQCMYAEDADDDDPGARYCNLDDLRELKPDVFQPYHEEMLMKEKGTIFRFPLRNFKMAKTSRIREKEMTKAQVMTLLDSFKEIARHSLFFLKNVKKIAFSYIREGKLTTYYSVDAKMTQENISAKQNLFLQRRIYGTKIASTEKHDFEESIESAVEMTIKEKVLSESAPAKEIAEEWIVVERIGSKTLHKWEEIMQAYNEGKLGLIPEGGVAVAMSTVRHTRHRAFCFLPLPVETGLPMHINGHFALNHESRRNLWEDDKTSFRVIWNEFVMSEIIAPAYITAMEFRRDHLADSLQTPMSETSLLGHIHSLEKLFPDSDMLADKHWKYLSKEIYKQLAEGNKALLPMANSFEVEHLLDYCGIPRKIVKCSVEWISLGKDSYKFMPVFCLNKKMSFDPDSIPNLMKRLNFQVVDFSRRLFKEFEGHGIPVNEISPKFVMDFLKSCGSGEPGSCQLRGIGGPVKDSSLMTVFNARLLLSYCKEAMTFQKEMTGLPLCVTNDGALQRFSEDNPVYCTRYCDIFSTVGKKFLHRCLCSTVRETETCCLKILSLEEFSGLLHCVLNVEKFSQSKKITHWMSNEKDIPNKDWILLVWEYFADVLKDTEKDSFKLARLQECVGKWKLLPVTSKSGCINYLEKMNLTKIVIDMSLSYLSEVLSNTLEGLGFPFLRDDIFYKCAVRGQYTLSEEAYELARSCVVSLEKPVEVLECLVHHLHNTGQEIVAEDCNTILGYLNNHLKHLKEKYNSDILRQKLCSIPVYITIDGHNTCLQNMQANVFVLPSNIPHDGIQQWAEVSGIVLLKQDDRVRDIQIFLRLETCKPIEIYKSHIIPRFLNLPPTSRLVHLEFMKCKLLNTDNTISFDEKQKDLIIELSRCPFLTVNNQQFCASSFVSPHNKLFKLMCSEDEFPPEPYNKKEWKKFMSNIGMQTEASPGMLVRFAKEIANDGRNKLTKETSEKSDMLLQHLLRRPKLDTELQDVGFNNIRYIRFIQPCKVYESLTRIHNQLMTTPLISFDGSASPQHTDVVWTAMQILPTKAMPAFQEKEKNAAVCRHLGIHIKPETDLIVKNLQNVSDSLKEKLKESPNLFQISSLQRIFEEHYKWLVRTTQKDESNLRKSLMYKPIIYLPEEHQCVMCDQVVYRLAEEDEIKPYLFCVPDVFVTYVLLFESLGTKRRVHANHYAKVLTYLKQDSTLDDGSCGSLEQNEIKNILYPAIKKLFTSIQMENLTETELFLPNHLFILQASNTLIASDNGELERRATNLEKRQFFIGFTDLGLEDSFPDEDFILQQLPERLRPLFLSEILEERIVSAEKCKAGDNVRKLSHFLRTEEFIKGVLRLLLDERRSAGRGYAENFLKDDEQKNIAKRIQNVRIQEVSSLITVLYYKESILEDSSESKISFATSEDSDIWTLYCCDEGKALLTWIHSIQLDFIRILTAVTNGELRKNALLASVILSCIDDPDLICRKLDTYRIKSLSSAKDISSLVFPCTGTFVPVNMHYLLDSSFSDLVLNDYAAMLLYEEEILSDGTTHPPVYIYVIVKACLSDSYSQASGTNMENMQSIYLLDIGELEYKKVPAFKIFKFQRRKGETSKEVQPAVQIDSPLGQQQLDTILIQVKKNFCAIMRLENKDERRIMMQRLRAMWHPDQNFGNEVQATKVFQFIEDLLRKVKNGESLDGQYDDSRYRGEDIPSTFRPFTPASNSHMSHGSNARRKKVSVPQEARRWLLQAEYDRTAAISFNPAACDVPAFNWICYMCHQAVEKALKAMWFNIDANNVTAKHDLSFIAQDLPDPELCGIARHIEGVVGYHTRMRYPDQHRDSKVPSNIYSKDSADKCVQLAEHAIEIASAFIHG